MEAQVGALKICFLVMRKEDKTFWMRENKAPKMVPQKLACATYMTKTA